MNEAAHIPDEWIEEKPYSWPRHIKESRLIARLDQLTRFHYERCSAYRNVVENVFGGLRRERYSCLDEIPFLPVSLFKRMELRSVPPESVIKILTSSGTTGGAVSRIHLDSQTATAQAKVLVRILQHFLGKARLPMIIIDHPGVIPDGHSYSARGAGIRGLIQFGKNPLYALRSDMSLNLDSIQTYLAHHQGKQILFFGFTFIIWKHLVSVLEMRGAKLPVRDGILIHSGGWKKMESEKVTRDEFNRKLAETCGIRRCINFYGMVEQIGSVFLENERHCLHAPIFSDILIRDPHTLRVLPPECQGLIQVLSMLPSSYPGHSLLTEDLGFVVGEDHPDLEMKGRYFHVVGRAPNVEPRGCSDTYAAQHSG